MLSYLMVYLNFAHGLFNFILGRVSMLIYTPVKWEPLRISRSFTHLVVLCFSHFFLVVTPQQETQFTSWSSHTYTPRSIDPKPGVSQNKIVSCGLCTRHSLFCFISYLHKKKKNAAVKHQLYVPLISDPAVSTLLGKVTAQPVSAGSLDGSFGTLPTSPCSPSSVILMM